jgi:hypothetical protein
MKIVWKLVLIYFCFTESCVPTYIDHVNVKTVSSNANTEQLQIKKLFVHCYGNISTRIVSESIYSALNKKMEQNGSISDFHFETIFANTILTSIKNIETDKYDGYMFFYPKEIASIDNSTKKFEFGVPVSASRSLVGAGYGSSYEESFRVELFNSKKELVYKGEIKFHFDPGKEAIYDKIAGKLIKQLYEAKISLW